MLYTSYFTNIRNIDKIHFPIRHIAICQYPPKWYTGYVYPNLAPTKELLFAYRENRINEEEYKKIYWKETLSLFTPDFIYAHLDQEPINVLHCHEPRDKFCHRHLFAEWINLSFGLPLITEWP